MRLPKLIPLAAICFLSSSFSLSQTTSSYTISGRVHDELDHDLGGVRVCAIPDNSRNANCGTSNAKGEFVVRVTSPGRYRIFPEKSQDGYHVQYQPFYRHPSTPIAEAVLDDSNKTSFVSVLVGPKNGILVGTTSDAITRRPVENVRFRLCHAANPQICWIVSSKNAAGEFRIPVSHVPFTLRALADGYEVWQGLSGSDKDTPISVASSTTMELNLYLRRRPEAAGIALSEAEKEISVNLPAPVQLSPGDRVEFDYFPRRTKLEWQPVDGAVSYTVEVDFCDGRVKSRRECLNPQPLYLKEKSPTRIMSTSYEFDFIGAQPGRWRVWAVDKNGQQGFKSPWRTFFFLK
jgi:hypothetical protein